MNWERVAEIKDELILRCMNDPAFVDKLAFVIAQMEISTKVNKYPSDSFNLFALGMQDMQKQMSNSILQQLGFDK